MSLWPTLLGVNLWLIAQLVPLGLSPGEKPLWLLCCVPICPLLLMLCQVFRRHQLAQLGLLVGVPLSAWMPSIEGPLAASKLHPPLAVLVQLAVLLLYLALTSAQLATQAPALIPVSAQGSPEDQTQSATRQKSDEAALWRHAPIELPPTTSQVKRQLWIYRLLLAMCAAIPLVFLWALDVHVPNLRALRESLGTPQRATAMRASLTAAVALLWTVLFQVGFVRPLQAHMEHDRDLQAQLARLRQRNRRGRPRAQLYLAMLLALCSTGLLLWWSI